MKLTELLPLTRCPRCLGDKPLRPAKHGDAVVCPSCATSYPLVQGVPALLPFDRSVSVMSREHRSHPLPPDARTLLDASPGYTLNLGAGGTDRRPPGCIEVEYSVFVNTTVVADAHILPFRDGVFDAIVTMNTFEHLEDPYRAATELRRVLRTGGTLHLQTAFLQPLHEEPHHYYNATEHGVRHWLRDFEIDECFVPPNMDINYMLAWLIEQVLLHTEYHLGPSGLATLERTTLQDWRAFWSDPSTMSGPLWELLRQLPQDAKRRFSGGFEVRATKLATPSRPD